MHQFEVCTCVAILAALSLPTANGDALHDHDNAPLSGVFGLPESTEGASLPGSGRIVWSALAATSSHALDESSAAEELVFDGETTRVELRLRYGIGERAELGIELPYLWQQSGSLDSFIDSWHSAFGLPDGARDELPRDALRFFVTDAGNELLNVTENSHGVGDVRLFAGYALSEGGHHQTALRFGVKLPTGDEFDLHGSGGIDLSLGFAGDVHALWGRDRLSGFYRLHAVHLGEPEWLSERYEEWVGLVSGGLSYQLTPVIGLAAQASFRTALYDTQLRELGQPAVTLTFGGQLRVSERWQLDIAVGEDVKVGSSPDVTFQLGLRFRPDQ